MKPFIAIIEGPMGSGKSTIGALVHKKLKRAALLSTDRIKWFISDFERGKRDNKITAKVMYAMVEEYLNQGISVLIAQGFWRKEYVDPYIKLAKEKNIDLFMYELEAPREVLLDRIQKRGKVDEARLPVPKERILKNLDTWRQNRYGIEKVFDTSKQDPEEVARYILKELKP